MSEFRVTFVPTSAHDSAVVPMLRSEEIMKLSYGVVSAESTQHPREEKKSDHTALSRQ